MNNASFIIFSPEENIRFLQNIPEELQEEVKKYLERISKSTFLYYARSILPDGLQMRVLSSRLSKDISSRRSINGKLILTYSNGVSTFGLEIGRLRLRLSY